MVALFGGYLFYLNQGQDEQVIPNINSETQTTETGFNKAQYSYSEPGSLWWIVNKDLPMADDYVPAEMTAPNINLRWAKSAESMQVDVRIAKPLEELVAAAKKAGYDLMLISAYRSEAYQKQLYDNYVRAYGEAEANRFSAKPGTSEHQTGMAVDLGRTDGKCEIITCFGDLPEGKWLAAHAYEYGFIVRYLDGKEDVTGYMYEPWHFRYVGKELAAELHSSGLTMEEFFNL